MFKVDVGDDIFGLFIAIEIGYGGKIPTLKALVSGIARPSGDGGIIFEPDYWPESTAVLSMEFNGSSEWILPGITITHFSGGTLIKI